MNEEVKITNKTKYDFSTFKKRLQNLAPLDLKYGKKYSYYRGDPVADDFSLEEIYNIIRSGDLDVIRDLSRYYYRVNARYRNNIDFLAHLPLYDSVVIPLFQEGKGSQVQITKSFYKACLFIDNMDIANTLTRITTQWLLLGVYNGLVRTKGEKITIQDLPLQYCRSRFKDFNNLNILEFNISYFDKFSDDEREEILATFPEIVQKAWRSRNKKIKNDDWVLIPAEQGGISFSFAHDHTPALIATIPELKKLDDAIKREAKRDENELYKLLIERMPIDSKGELVFQLEEVADIHASVVDMLKDIDTVDVLTTFGEANLENLQDSTSASQSTDRLEKYTKNAQNALGRGDILFNPINSTGLSYSIKKDEALMQGYLNVYETWIKFLINYYFSRSGLDFDFKILPLTVFNRQELQQTYFRGAQYGYSKMVAGVAMGIKQRDQLSLMNFENDFLEMSLKMVPLQSSYTMSSDSITNEEKNNTNSVKTTSVNQDIKDIDNKGGRPTLPDNQKSEKTQQNIESAQ